MDHDEVEVLRRQDAAWRLLRAENAALVVGFLGRVFVDENVREISATALVDRLDDELYALNARLGEGTYPRSAKAYLDDWAGPGAGWLRKYYPAGSDEPFFDATPALEKAVAFVRGLRGREFIGTESRLHTLFELLRGIAYGTETDVAPRLAQLHQQRADLDAEIARVELGEFQILDRTAQLDRFQQFATTARELLADFREVEANFRRLDRELRARIASWAGAKGELLDVVLADRGSIADSDQGKSFGAFYDFLLSHGRQREFGELLDKVLALDTLADADPRMRGIHYEWLAAGERTQATVRLLSEQLRRFLDDRVWLENRRIVEVLRAVEGQAFRLREHAVDLPGMSIDCPAPKVTLPMERPLYSPRPATEIASTGIDEAREDFDVSTLMEQVHVDTTVLAEVVRRSLGQRPQVSLATLVERRPLEQGLGELVGYLSLADEMFQVVFDEEQTEQVRWRDSEDVERTATIPRVSFVRRLRGEGAMSDA